jgi:hypothetical protein
LELDDRRAVDLLQLWLRLAPQPLLTFNLCQSFLALVPLAKQQSPRLRADLAAVVARLSRQRRTVLRRLAAALLAMAVTYFSFWLRVSISIDCFFCFLKC